MHRSSEEKDDLKPKHGFKDRSLAKRAGKKGGQVSRPATRYFSINREAAAEAGRKSRWVAPKPVPVPDDTAARAIFEEISGDYAKLVPWDKLAETARDFWRKRAKD